MERRPEGSRGLVLSLAVPASVAVGYTEPGQYCRLAVGGEEGFFAIASPPGQAVFEFFVQPAGGVSDRLVALPVDAEVEVGPPLGAGYGLGRVLADEGPVVVLATGSGYSGVRAALHVLHAAGRPVHLWVGARTADDVIFSHEFAGFREAGSRVEVALSRPDEGAGWYVQQALAAAAPDLHSAWVLACGQPAMVGASRLVCADLGLPADRFLTNH